MSSLTTICLLRYLPRGERRTSTLSSISSPGLQVILQIVISRCTISQGTRDFRGWVLMHPLLAKLCMTSFTTLSKALMCFPPVELCLLPRAKMTSAVVVSIHTCGCHPSSYATLLRRRVSANPLSGEVHRSIIYVPWRKMADAPQKMVKTVAKGSCAIPVQHQVCA